MVGGEDWSQATIVDPSGSYSGNSYLDVKYCQDLNPGEIYMSEGLWTINPIKWFRLACVEPVLTPVMSLSWRKFAPPDYTKLGMQRDEVLSIENLGNTDLHYTTTIIEDNGPSGWLALSGFSGTTPSGLSNIETGTVNLNNGGVQNTEAHLAGRIIFNSDAPSSPDTVTINLLVLDTLVTPYIDTFTTGCLALAVKNNGNYGAMGVGGINLDWTYSGSDCDTTADVYLYDASPVLLRIEASDTLYSNSFYNTTILDPTGFRPQVSAGMASEQGVVDDAWYYFSDEFVDKDSLVAMRKLYYASTNSDSCDFVIQGFRVVSNSFSEGIDGLMVGEIIDWDIPSDTARMNESGFDFSRNLIYQVGAEFHQDDDPDSCGGVDQPDCPCQDSDGRYGGVAFIEAWDYSIYDTISTTPFGAYTAENDRYIYPEGNYNGGELYNLMTQSGFNISDSVEDLHTVIIYDTNLYVPPKDYFLTSKIYFTVLATVENGSLDDLKNTIDKAKTWYYEHGIRYLPYQIGCCTGTVGDINYDGGYLPDISDLLYLVDYMFMPGSPAPPCMAEGDLNGDGGAVPDISDLLYLVEYMFLPGGGPLPPC